AKNDVPADNPTKENYKSATEKLTAAITKATEAKKAIDQEEADFEAAKTAYDAKVKEAEELVAHLADEKYKEIKKTLEEEISATQVLISSQNPTKNKYELATKTLIEQITKATEAKNAIDLDEETA
ncbi:hypothetical protein, partial [Mycoplasmopsis arginini]|uniref:hypothetical protein n=1 Tax=Mycoplasmopsis arginini TaxID=2094 RepID=UPI00249F6A74